jgi:hypothetical protein
MSLCDTGKAGLFWNGPSTALRSSKKGRCCWVTAQQCLFFPLLIGRRSATASALLLLALALAVFKPPWRLRSRDEPAVTGEAG